MLRAGLATRGMDAATRFRILKRHLWAVLRHATPRKLINLVKTERNLRRKAEALDSFPYILKIESTNICNLHCAFCYDNRRQPQEGERGYGRMQPAQFRHVVDQLAPYLFKINMYGFGEPFLFSEGFEMIRYATDKNIGVGVSSNMNIRDDALAEKIIDSGLEVLIFSCHGVTPESYATFMGKGNMELALENIKRLVALKRARKSTTPVIDWQFCVTGFNENEIPLAEQKARELGVDQVRFIKPFFPDDAPAHWWSSKFPRNLEEQAAEAETHCAWLYRSAFVNFDGGVSPCCSDVRPLVNDFGNALTQPFADIWNGPAYRAARRLLRNPHDATSQAARVCQRCPLIVNARKRGGAT
ncbi:MAG: SPASM domain-containing protein [Desulfovibrio sp.]|nr:SPASM domain-containing protein [Desulfovibrio sp.]MCA1987455.1 SPASM domain-containing protein [Desulfovibrio sp.]